MTVGDYLKCYLTQQQKYNDHNKVLLTINMKEEPV